MGFYYDQGRDALVIWKLWHEGKPFLIGPVTGLSGIFLGPFYYYLIAPLYLIGKGDPVFPAFFLAFTTVLALILLYILGWKMRSKVTGIVASIIGSFSYFFVLGGRWLSNPAPMYFLSMLLLWVMWGITTLEQTTKNKGQIQNLWVIISLLIGISLQFESASAVFYLPMIALFAIWQRKKLPDKKTMVIAFSVFLFTILPQILFNYRHDNLLFKNIKKVIIEEKSFRNPLSLENLEVKKDYFWTVFSSKIFPNGFKFAPVFHMASIAGILKLIKTKKNEISLLLFFIGIPMIGYFFFQGNHGNIYDYYMTGYYFPMILFFSLGLTSFWENIIGKLLVVSFLLIFLIFNLRFTINYLNSPIGGPDGVSLGNELQAVNWIYDNAKAEYEFNVDVYVPPVIPHSYDYLFLWQGTLRQAQGKRGCDKYLCGLTIEKNVPVLYTLYEADAQHPDRLSVWLERQGGIGKVITEESFANITVQKRERL